MKVLFPAEINSEILLYLDPIISRSLRYDFVYKKMLKTIPIPQLWKQMENINIRNFLVKYCVPGYDHGAVKEACKNGYLDIIVYISNKELKRNGVLFYDAMNLAATNGHLDIVRFLHEN